MSSTRDSFSRRKKYLIEKSKQLMVMKSGDTPPAPRFKETLPLPATAFLGFSIAVVVVIAIGIISYYSLRNRDSTQALVERTFEVLEALQAVTTHVTNAETGQRGYLITGDDPYLQPYLAAITGTQTEVDRLKALVGDDQEQTQRAAALEAAITAQYAELARTVELRQGGDAQAALALVRTDEGLLLMERIKTLLAQMAAVEQESLELRQEDWQGAASLSVIVTLSGVGLLLLLIAAGAATAARDFRARELQGWLRTGSLKLSERIQGEKRIETLADEVLGFLVRYLGGQIGAVYVVEGDARLQRVAGYAVAAGQPSVLAPGEGLAGQVAKERSLIHVTQVPAGYLPITSATGSSDPHALLISPAVVDDAVQAVVEIGFLHAVAEPEKELLTRVAESLAIAIRSSRDRSRLEELLEETQRQSEELQSQQEELRVSNEELQVHERSLKESQARLETQQAELEQTNAQLEEHAQAMQHQRDSLAEAQASLAQKAAELQRTNQYKSEFLANMSHELRTPLNSTLILAKLLADNKSGNLTEEQVRFARAISASGNDLLALINDVLDLSKIEAGKVDIELDAVSVVALVESLQQTFGAGAREKGLDLRVEIAPDVPTHIQSDFQRLAQILRNLLSNALKFTERGSVTLSAGLRGPETIAFEVRDTGIGIAPHQQEVIFEAFRQADGSTHRRYGGTGLGLSISRDLARLLGGDIVVSSEDGQGSVFTLILPLQGPSVATVAQPRAEKTVASRTAGPVSLPKPEPREKAPLAEAEIDDDRHAWTRDSRGILVVEDDPRFAAILRDLARERGFHCIVTHTAADALASLDAYPPKAILLDIQLPDQSGLGVLEQLKHDPRTRHIPVHVASVSDFSQEALELGAVGYALKPVRREQLVEALERLESKFSQSLRRVLVVEDNAAQRESIRLLLETSDVQIIGVSTAAEALSELEAGTFDCVVVDLNLPDVSGYDLLQAMAEIDSIPFPPVIVYTGRLLTRAEEQQLRRFSKSIIIKDARSPERLLDEVTLFLHQVEATLPPDRQKMLREARDREARFEGRRILIVEDDVRNIFALTSLLEPKGARIEVARNGREALEVLDRGGEDPEIDLVLMDIMMPEMDGLEAMRQIRKRPEWKRIPIIALTAKAMGDDRQHSLEAGANDYIAKPLDVERLISLIRVWMK